MVVRRLEGSLDTLPTYLFGGISACGRHPPCNRSVELQTGKERP